MCDNTPGSYHCSCKSGFVMLLNKKDCKGESKKVFMVREQSSLRGISPGNSWNSLVPSTCNKYTLLPTLKPCDTSLFVECLWSIALFIELFIVFLLYFIIYCFMLSHWVYVCVCAFD